MYCKVKKSVKYNVDNFEITISVPIEELLQLRAVLVTLSDPKVQTILDEINKVYYV